MTDLNRERHARRALASLGYELHKGKQFGRFVGFMISDLRDNYVVAGTNNGTDFELSIEDVEDFIREEQTQ